MKGIVRFTGENFMRLEAVTIEPNGNAIIIGGDNNQGKTSVLLAIEAALGGDKHSPAMPIREGADGARVVLETEDYIITRTWTEKGSYLKVTTRPTDPNKPMLQVQSPQALLDKLTGDLTFDPLALLSMKPKEQVELLKRLAGLDFSELDAQRKELFDERTLLNRQLREQPAQVNSFPEDWPTEPIDTAALAAELSAASAKSRQLTDESHELRDIIKRAESVSAAVEQARSKRDTLKLQLEQAETELHALEDKLDDANVDAQAAEVKLSELAWPDTEALERKLNEATVHNRQVDEYRAEQSRMEAARQATERLSLQVKGLTESIEQIDAQKQQRLAEARMPLEGLTFNEDGLVLEGIPFEQASDSQKLRASVALGMALNPELRVMLINQGSELDQRSLAELVDIAEELDCQVWVVRVSKGAECSVIIEDGSIVESLAGTIAESLATEPALPEEESLYEPA